MREIKTIGLTVAMHSEFEMMKDICKANLEKVTFGNNIYDFYFGNLDGLTIIMIESGIGKVNAAIISTILVEHFRVDMIISSGVCGSLNNDGSINPGDIILASEVCYHDVWCGKPNEPGQVQGCDAKFVTEMPVLYIVKHLTETLNLNCEFHTGTILSGDWFVETKVKAMHIAENYGYAEGLDMESGAIAQVCHKAGILFQSIRIVSDCPLYPGEPKKYEDFWTTAPKYLSQVVRESIHYLITLQNGEN